MLARQKEVIAAHERVQGFLNRTPLPNAPANYAERKEELDRIIVRLRALLADQEAGQRESRDDTTRQKTARRVLVKEHLAPLSRIAKAFLPQDPETQQALYMPENSLATGRLIAVASGMRTTAAKYERLFVENGRPPDFLERLDRAIEGVRRTVLSRAESVGRHVSAKAGLQQELRRARRCVQMLDAMVLDAFAGQADVIANWRVTKRVQETKGPTFRGTGGTAEENLEPPKAA